MEDITNKNSQSSKKDEPLKKEARTVRARSRTVLLTPEVTGEMRSKINSKVSEENTPNTSGFSGISSNPSGFTGRHFQEQGKEHSGRDVEVSSFSTASEMENGIGNRNSRLATTLATPRPQFSGLSSPVSNENSTGSFTNGIQARVSPIYSPEGCNRGNGLIGNRPPTYRDNDMQENSRVANPIHDCAVYEKPSPIVGFLISYDNNENGEVLELREGRLIITSEASSHGNYIYLNDSSVSPMHAVLRVAKGSKIQVLDQLSEFGTKITKASDKKVVELSGEKGVVSHGDKISFGERTFSICLLSA